MLSEHNQLAIVLPLRREIPKAKKLPTEVELLFRVLSGIATGLSWIYHYRALQLGPATMVAPVNKLSVAIEIILAALFLKKPLTWQNLLGGGNDRRRLSRLSLALGTSHQRFLA